MSFPSTSLRTAFLAGCSIAFTLLAGAPAEASCPSRVGVAHGATVASIARACGVSAEALRRLNPGLMGDTVAAGTFVNVPRPALPSPTARIGQTRIETRQPRSAVGPPTVVIPPLRQPAPQPHIVPNLGPLPGQHPMPGHHFRIP